jgi:hypothetical protein
VWNGCIWLRIGTSGGEHGNEPSGSIKGGEFLDIVIISLSRMILLHEIGWLVSLLVS